MHMQLNRAKRRRETQDMELAMDMMIAFSATSESRNVDSAILLRLANKLELHTLEHLKTETSAVAKLFAKSKNKATATNTDTVQQVMGLLDKFKQAIGVDDQTILDHEPAATLIKCLEKSKSLLIPHEFLCPINLEIMIDPVIIATGQVFNQSYTELIIIYLKISFCNLAVSGW